MICSIIQKTNLVHFLKNSRLNSLVCIFKYSCLKLVENGANGVVGLHALKIVAGERQREQDLVKGKKESATRVKENRRNKSPAPNNPFVVRICKD